MKISLLPVNRKNIMSDNINLIIAIVTRSVGLVIIKTPIKKLCSSRAATSCAALQKVKNFLGSSSYLPGSGYVMNTTFIIYQHM